MSTVKAIIKGFLSWFSYFVFSLMVFPNIATHLSCWIWVIGHLFSSTCILMWRNPQSSHMTLTGTMCTRPIWRTSLLQGTWSDLLSLQCLWMPRPYWKNLWWVAIIFWELLISTPCALYCISFMSRKMMCLFCSAYSFLNHLGFDGTACVAGCAKVIK